MGAKTSIKTRLDMQYQKTLELNKQKNKFVFAWVAGGFFGIHRFIINKKISGSIFLSLSLISIITICISIFTINDLLNVYFISSIITLLLLMIWSIFDLGIYLKRFEKEKKTIMEDI